MLFQDFVNWFAKAGNVLAAVQVVAAFVTALATLALWRVTKVLAVETSALAKMSSQPFVVCVFESSGADPTALNLVLRNTGNATAFDIHVCITPALPSRREKKDDGKVETVFAVSVLPPDQALPRRGLLSHEIVDDAFEVSISWARKPNDKERENLTYKFSGEDGFRSGWREMGLHQIAKELEKLTKQIRK